MAELRMGTGTDRAVDGVCAPSDGPTGAERSLKTEDDLVAGLGAIMREKLAVNRVKRHWAGQTPQWLLRRLREEMSELEAEFRIAAADPAELDIYAIGRECADIACFAAMIADVVGELKRRRELNQPGSA